MRIQLVVFEVVFKIGWREATPVRHEEIILLPMKRAPIRV